MSNFDKVIFKKKTFSNILEDIYDNSRKTEKQINDLISNLSNFVDGPGAAAVIVPLIAQYLEVKVKNDEHLIKMAAIVQRAMDNSSGNGEFILTMDEEKALLEEAKKIHEQNISEKTLPLLKNE